MSARLVRRRSRRVLDLALACGALCLTWGASRAAAQQPGAAPAGGCPRASAAAELRERAQAALGASIGEKLAPLLPDGWPEPRGAVFYTYERRALPTGMVAYAVRGPVRRITFAPLTGAPRVEPLPARELAGRETAPPLHPEPAGEALARAEQALVEVVAGCRTLPDAAPALEPYRQWLAAHPAVAAELAGRAPEFLGWLQCTQLRERYEALARGATGRCRRDADCACYDSIIFDQGGEQVAEREVAAALQQLVKESRQLRCPVVFVDLPAGHRCRAACQAGQCQQRAEAPPHR